MSGRATSDSLPQEDAVKRIGDSLGCDRLRAFEWLRLVQPHYQKRPGDPPGLFYNTAEIDRLLRLARMPKGGRPPSAIPVDLLIAAGAWLHAVGLPDKQAELEEWLQQRLAATDREPSESTVREYAKRILTAHRRALEEADN